MDKLVSKKLKIAFDVAWVLNNESVSTQIVPGKTDGAGGGAEAKGEEDHSGYEGGDDDDWGPEDEAEDPARGDDIYWLDEGALPDDAEDPTRGDDIYWLDKGALPDDVALFSIEPLWAFLAVEEVSASLAFLFLPDELL